MKAIKANLLNFLQKAGNFKVPAFQRKYTWTTEQCQRLWDDLAYLVKNETSTKSHFFGMIIYSKDGINQISSANTACLIDGQQRLVTISLLFAALNKVLSDSTTKDEITRRKIKNAYLFNDYEEKDQKYKLLLKDNDFATYKSIIDNNEELPIQHSEQLVENFYFFKKAIINSEIAPHKILVALEKFEIIDTAIQEDIDNVQHIYEGANSSGVMLTAIDKIRNIVLYSDQKEKQEELYKNYWSQMEQAFANTQTSGLFKAFLNDYLTIQNAGKIIETNQLAPSFKDFFEERSKYQSSQEILKHIYRYSRYYLQIVFNTISNSKIRKLVADINDFEAKDAYPFLMEVFDDYENELITESILIEILKTAKNFIIQRQESDQDENSMSFADLSNNINKMLALKELTPKVLDDNGQNVTKIRDLINVQ